MVFRFRDSLHLLPGSLVGLAKSLCPELGCKGSFDHSSVTVHNLSEKMVEAVKYMKQDILLLGGILQKAQRLCWDQYAVEIEGVFNSSSLALTIFRSKYYDAEQFPIHIPKKNEDKFIPASILDLSLRA